MGIAYDRFLAVKQAQAAADLTTMRRLFAPDATLYEPYVSGTVHGPAVAEYLGTICGTEFAALDYVVLSAIGDGDRAAVELDEVVTLFDDAKVHLRNCTIVECRDDVIVRWYEYLQPMKRLP